MSCALFPLLYYNFRGKESAPIAPHRYCRTSSTGGGSQGGTSAESMQGWRLWDFFPIVSPYPVCYNQGEREGGRIGPDIIYW
jgi:hypothetical protein